MKIYKKVLIAIGAVILDFLISYFGLRLFIYIGYAQERFVDKWTIIALMFIAPFALAAAGLVIFGIFRLIHDIYIGIKYGIEVAYKDHENNRDNF